MDIRADVVFGRSNGYLHVHVVNPAMMTEIEYSNVQKKLAFPSSQECSGANTTLASRFRGCTHLLGKAWRPGCLNQIDPGAVAGVGVFSIVISAEQKFGMQCAQLPAPNTLDG